MHVKLEPNKELYIPTCLMDDFEMDFREELFGNNLDASESNSDDDFLSRLSTDDGSFAIPNKNMCINNGFGHQSISSSSTCSDSSSIGGGFNELDYQLSLYTGLEDGNIDATKMEEVKVKMEPYSPEMAFLSDCPNPGNENLNFLLCDGKPPLLNSMGPSIPETPPVTPPEGITCKDESPPHSPLSEGSPPLVHTSLCSPSSSRSAASLSPSNTNRILKIPKRLPDSRPTTISTIKKKIALAPKTQPIKFVTIKTNGAELPQISTISKSSTNTSSSLSFLTSSCSSLVPTTVPTAAKAAPSQQSSNPSLPPLAPAINSTPKQNVLDMRALKRQERMIKNRESASASRKRKKMYVQSLEEENMRLKEENERLHHRVSLLEKECAVLKSIKGGHSIRRSSTVLLGVAFLFLFNFSMIFSRNAFHHNSSKEFVSNPFAHDVGLTQSPRAISKGENVPRRSLLWLSSFDNSEGNSLRNATHICPLYINASESRRIENELRDWFDLKPERKLDHSTKRKSRRGGFHPKTKFGRERALSSARKEEEGVPLQDLVEVDKALAPQLTPAVREVPPPTANKYKYLYSQEEVSHVPSFDSPESLLSQNLHSILEAIDRRDDTYYVVSLSHDHLLVPASSRNSSSTRPRMSLLMSPPKSALNHSLSEDPSQVGFMQIDCEVTHTKVVQVARNSVPSYLPMPEGGAGGGQPTGETHNLTLDSLGKEELTSARQKHKKRRVF